tara:strand:+ start:303 stop:752 length:450 start_codon:yes stop_codon:yes gene_type:complete
MKLSKHFSLQELCKSQTAVRLGIDNLAKDENVITNLKTICENILEPIRENYGIPFSPNSAYRSPKLNNAVGSSQKSQHLKGQAVDIEIPSIDNYELAQWIRNNLKFDQLILEFYNGEPSSGWVHVSFADENRNQLLTFNGKDWNSGLIK